MKNYITLLFLVISFVASSQIKEVTITPIQLEEINQTFANYLNDIQAINKDWDKITSYTYPPLFELFSKEDIIQQLKNAFENSIYNTTFDVMEVINGKGSFAFEDIIYSKIVYNNQFTFHFKEDKTQSEKDFNLYLDYMTETFKNKFNNMQVERLGDNIIFKGEKIILAVLDEVVGSWKMLEYVEESESFYAMFLPKEVAKEISSPK